VAEQDYRRITGVLSDEIVRPLVAAYLMYAVLFGTVPFSLSLDSSVSIGTLLKDKFSGTEGLSRVTAWDVWTNIIYFVPFGALLILHPFMYRRTWYTKLFLATCTTTLVSTTIEIFQLLLPRRPSIEDIVCNAIGGLLGGAVGICAQAFLEIRGAVLLKRVRLSTTLAVLTTAYVVFLLATISLPLPLPRDLRNWNETYRLFLGNEGTLDRPWSGRLYLVAVYDRALSPEEVRANFSAGYLAGSRQRRTDNGLVLYYDFSEQTGEVVHDQAGGMPPVDLQIEDPSRVEWIAPNGITLKADTVISSADQPEKLASGTSRPRSELTVEAWFAPTDLDQTGPARIVSYSLNADERNFTLGQQNAEIIFRLRTPVSGVNGTQPELRSDDAPVTVATQHYLVTFSDGMESLYINGKVHRRMALRSQVSLSDRIIESIGKPFKWLVYSVLIFPLGILVTMFYQQQSFQGGNLLCLATVLVALSIIQVLRPIMVGKTFEPAFVPVAAITVLAAVMLFPRSSFRHL
jgi:VanZ family protein